MPGEYENKEDQVLAPLPADGIFVEGIVPLVIEGISVHKILIRRNYEHADL